MTEDNDSLFDFPCQFPIKIMGKASDHFEIAVVQIIRQHIPDLHDSAVKRRESKQNNYAALTVTITAHSRQQLDAIYMDLTASEHVIMAI